MILLDTTPLVALCDRHDAKNALARRQLKKLSSAAFASCEAVLVEACFHLPYAFERQRLRALLNDLDVALLAESATADFRDEAFDWLLKYADQEPDWADACLAALSGRYPDASVWTYDREFRTTWRQPSGRAIPLALSR